MAHLVPLPEVQAGLAPGAAGQEVRKLGVGFGVAQGFEGFFELASSGGLVDLAEPSQFVPRRLSPSAKSYAACMAGSL